MLIPCFQVKFLVRGPQQREEIAPSLTRLSKDDKHNRLRSIRQRCEKWRWPPSSSLATATAGERRSKSARWLKCRNQTVALKTPPNGSTSESTGYGKRYTHLRNRGNDPIPFQ